VVAGNIEVVAEKTAASAMSVRKRRKNTERTDSGDACCTAQTKIVEGRGGSTSSRHPALKSEKT
jgi:hypothetical protein